MKRHRLLFALCSMLAALACERAETPDQATPEPPDTASAAVAASTPTRGPSLYDLSLDLTDQDGRSLGLDVFRGHPVVVSMFYSSCGYACPTLLSDIQRFERSLKPEVRDDVRVLLVSFDSARDTPERLKEVAAERKVDLTRWRLVRTSEAEVRGLAAALGFKYRKQDDGSFNHSSSITLLDGEGVVADRVEGLSQPLDTLVARAAAISGAAHP